MEMEMRMRWGLTWLGTCCGLGCVNECCLGDVGRGVRLGGELMRHGECVYVGCLYSVECTELYCIDVLDSNLWHLARHSRLFVLSALPHICNPAEPH
jgi:hypothetical protein